MSDFSAVIPIIRSFVVGDMDIDTFMNHYFVSEEIERYLEGIIDTIEKEHLPIKRRTVCMKGVNQGLPFEVRASFEIYLKEYAQSFRNLSAEWKQNPPRMGYDIRRTEYRTSLGAYHIHSTVSDIYYQVDTTIIKTEKYGDEYSFLLDVLPNYLSGGVDAENFVSQHILPHYPATMKKGERRKQIKDEINRAFLRDCKGYPRWIQAPEWPLDSDGKPMIYTGQKHFEDYSEYYFRNAANNQKQTITQWW